jgi:hypothetical protein
MPTPFAVRDAKLSGAIDRAFGELFTLTAFMVGGDVDSPKAVDQTRPSFDVVGCWEAPAKSTIPHARGSVQDDNAQKWNASMPSVSIADDSMRWKPQPGDRIIRAFDGSAYQISKALPDGMGRTVLFLTARQR